MYSLYVGKYKFAQVGDEWKKNETKQVSLYNSNAAGELVAAKTDKGVHKKVDVMNHIGTLAYKSAADRYGFVAEIPYVDAAGKKQFTYFIMTTEC